MKNAPYNPFKNYIVSASAGCGKTYQLSRRFVFLVGAGANPSNILTITFTKKAASEMRDRIISDAARLLTDKKFQESFSSELNGFLKTYDNKKHHLRNPVETARKILASSGELLITTIDSTFWSWLAKFPYEAGGDQGFPVSFDLLPDIDKAMLNERSWDKLCQTYLQDTKELKTFLELCRKQGVFYVKNRVLAISKYNLDSYLWLESNFRDNGLPAFNPYPLFESQYADIKDKLLDEKLFLDLIKPDVLKIASYTKDKINTAVIEAFSNNDLSELMRAGLIKKNFDIYKTAMRQKKSLEILRDEIFRVESFCKAYFNGEIIKKLNAHGELLINLYMDYNRIRNDEKFHAGHIEYSDLAKGCYKLFANPDAFGARYLIFNKISHLLLDEFQDTSKLQWIIFKEIANELVSGTAVSLNEDNYLPSSVFIVGDKKQSIYGFREADSSIMDDCANFLMPFNVNFGELNESFRSAQIILDYINEVFGPGRLMEDFPEHLSNPDLGGGFNHGQINVSKLFVNDDNTQKPPIEQEAEFVASYFSDLFKAPPLVFDKKLKTYRFIKPKDCAILYRKSTHVQIFEDALRSAGVSCRKEESKGFFDRTEIKDIICLLKWISYPNDVISFCSVLKSPIVGLNDNELLASIESSFNEEGSLGMAQSILNYLEKNHFYSFKLIDEFKSNIKGFLPHQIILFAIKHFDILNNYKAYHGEQEAQLVCSNIIKLIEQCSKLEKSGYVLLPSLLNRLEQIDDIASASTGTDSVNLMTIHKAKGLEFALVALIDTGSIWEKSDPYWAKTYDDNLGHGLSYIGTKDLTPKNHFAFDNARNSIYKEFKEESRRLLYVALSRARHYLLITGHSTKKVPDEKIGFWGHLKTSLINLKDKYKILKDENQMICQSLSVNQCASPDVIDKVTPQISSPLNISHMPFETKIINPHSLIKNDANINEDYSQSSESTLYGSLVHKALELMLNNYTEEDIKNYLKAYKTETVYKAILEAQNAYDYPPFKELIQNSLSYETEKNIIHYKENILIRGVIDLLLFHPKEKIIIIDYKTSSKNLSIEKYKGQLKSYLDAIQQMYPTYQITSKIFFTKSMIIRPLLCQDSIKY